jgi:hypothetical protein
VLFEATHTHQASQCPLLTSDGKNMIKKLYSDENVTKSGIKIAAAYMSCPIDSRQSQSFFYNRG